MLLVTKSKAALIICALRTLKQLRYKVRKVFGIIKPRFGLYSRSEVLFQCR